MSESAQEKTELPSPKKRREAAEEGNVPRSKDLATAGGILAVAAILPDMARDATAYVKNALSAPLPTTLDREGALLMISQSGDAVLQMLGPLFLAVFVCTALALSLPKGPVFASKKVEVKLDRVYPWKGISRLNPSQTFPKALLDMLRLFLILGAAGQFLISQDAIVMTSLATGSANGTARALLELTTGLSVRIGGAFFLLAIFDFLLERRRIEKELKMTRQEVREEQKRTEGDPLIKARIRRVQREMSRRRLEDVKTASVVVTNPTHVACALLYDRGIHAAPRLLAKGRGGAAQEIKRVAREAGVPCHEDKPLAWALLRVPVGGEIPEHLYRAVAEVLALIERAKRRTKAGVR